MQKTQILPEIAQQFFESATNAAEKGQSQFFTPLPLAQKLSEALPATRPVITDFNCGAGHLLHGAANKTTVMLLGSDIDPCRGKVGTSFTSSQIGDTVERVPTQRITHDLTLLYPLLQEINARFDLVVLNPPWRLFWHRDRLQALVESELPSVRAAFKAVEPGTPRGTIDSTIATLLMAMDRLTIAGEGYLIANNNTLERLIFSENAPFAALLPHIWARVVIPGNPMTGIEDCNLQKKVGTTSTSSPISPPNLVRDAVERIPTDGEDFNTGVIYFARDHNAGPQSYSWPTLPDRCQRLGGEVRSAWNADSSTIELWHCAKEEVKQRTAGMRSTASRFNLYLQNGVVKTNLSQFEKKSTRIDKTATDRLFKLNGKAPMQLVLQRPQREEVLDVMDNGGWRVEPALRDAIEQAIRDYHAARAPLYPLPEIQRLGYLDENDTIECKHSLAVEGREPMDESQTPSTLDTRHSTIFVAGQSYPIRTQTVGIERTVTKPNPYTGDPEELEFKGQELAIYIKGEIVEGREPMDESQKPALDTRHSTLDPDREYCFMDERLRKDKSCKIADKPAAQVIDFTLQELCAHFKIPDVPDVATVNPQKYQDNLNLLTELETLTEIAA